MALAPALSQTFATSQAFICSSSQPLLILTVTGTDTAFTTALTISLILLGSFNSALPAWALRATFGTGHPIFISIISGCICSSTIFAEATKEAISLPNIC